MKIAGQHFAITGANRGIGLAVAQMAAEEKAHVHLIIRKPDPELAAQLKKAGAASVHVWIADLASRAGVEKLLLELKDQQVDILFNNAGLLTGGLLEEQPIDEIYSMFQVNLLSLVQLTQGLIPRMVKRGAGKIINNSSVSAYMHFPCATTYAASKSAVVAFTECLQVELESTGVTTLCLITPGIKTRMFDEIDVKYSKNFEIPTDSISPEQYAGLIKTAIEKDQTHLFPKGTTAIGLWLAQNTPKLFGKAIKSRFKR